MFELGFFSPGKSKNRYVGIWYKKISQRTIVWVANREKPINDTTGVFEVSKEGALHILGGGNALIWSSNTTVSVSSRNLGAQLLDDGNLVLWNEHSTIENPIWQSFDYPGDTILPGMKLGKDLVTGREWCLTSWKSPDDPSIGPHIGLVDTHGYPQIFQKEGGALHARLGPWNGVGFRGFPIEIPNPIYSMEFAVNNKEIYYRYKLKSSVVQRLFLSWDGVPQRLNWVERTHEWAVYGNVVLDRCDHYGRCGPYGTCSINVYPSCICLEGFEPRLPKEWNAADWSGGCQHKQPLRCGGGDGFRKISGIKFPDTRHSWYNVSMTLHQCAMTCKKNCSCTAYAQLDIRNGGRGCLLWFHVLMDMREYDEKQELYIRMAASELAERPSFNKKKVLLVVLTISSAALLLSAVAYVCKRTKKGQGNWNALDKKNTSAPMDDLDSLLFFNLHELAKATDNFSTDNKLGEGGFGPVYKGVLEDEREIAVKRLSKTSQQGLDEFKNEVICIAKLQHRNLVKLLGYCIHGNELILVYEYMANNSLDSFLFDETRSSILDWPRRFHIIHGMARGILYLHQDSRLQIIHRDLKAGNVLLDGDMNPKISDFGLARRFVGQDALAKTKKVVGTYGYISPEYAVHGRFSTKSDVFSFGVLVLEIVSGKKNRGFSHDGHSDNLLGHAWRLYNEDKSIEIMCASLRNSCIVSEVIRAIHVGLLCVQHHAKDRPTMLSVVLMLVSESELPPPKQPAFFTEESCHQHDPVSSQDESAAAVDTISRNQAIKDGDTIVSDGEMFELGFFSPGKSKNRYLGIWYKKISKFTVVWVANRENPINDTSGVFEVSSEGALQILSGGDTLIWSSNTTVSVSSRNLGAQLLDDGNFVLWDEHSTIENPIWQSFDYIGDTLLPGMKLGKDMVTKREWCVTSWKSPEDPSIGLHKSLIDTHGYPQVFQTEGGAINSRLGPWNGVRFCGFPNENTNPIYSVEFVVNEKEIYYRYKLNSSILQRLFISWDGVPLRLNWVERTQEWVVYGNVIFDRCGRYGLCGPYGTCSINVYPPCICMEGFEPRFPNEWDATDWSGGCQHKQPFRCGSGDGFRKISGVKFPDTRQSWYNTSMTLDECEMACREDCNCTAYANLDIRNGGSGCLLWFHELMDMREFDEKQELYVRMSASELAGLEKPSFNKKKVLLMVLTISSSALLLSAVAYVCKKSRKRRGNRNALDKKNTSVPMDDLDSLPFFSLHEIAKATDNFSINNKIGEGGFGPVYKGVLDDGREVAVKRLSETSQQGLDEFKNELICMAKLQHRNLVKLLGYCIHSNELILIYEYMTNKSLDSYLFDETKRSILDWPRRFHIINGMARGILYLHQDSRLQIIHRDLKAGNVLLDGDMNPKISDFGLARKFVGKDAIAKTKKVVGTYGYISPEYAIHGRFSTKSDVFSFGVLVLEIVSGKKNRGFCHEGHGDNLLGHAWRLYREGKSIEIMCASLHNSCIVSEVLRAIHVGLLCVQHHAEDRPTMLSVVLMLVSESALPPPKQPAFFTEESFRQHDSVSSQDEYMITLLSAAAVDTISRNQAIKDGDTIVSAGQMFELGFFSPGKSKNRYLGIWYKKISTGIVVWVANRETPINDTSGVLKVSSEGDLQILGAGNTLIWSSNTTVSVSSRNLGAQLLDSGNLVLLDEHSTLENPIWQSFDYPGDTLLPGMKLGKDLVTGREWCLTSWKSLDDPSIGLHKSLVDTHGYPQIFQREGGALHSRLGPWNGIGFRGFPIENTNLIYSVEFVVNEKEIYYRYKVKSSVAQRISVSWDGIPLRLNWVERMKEWVVDGNIVIDRCGRYGRCGPDGTCSINTYPPCICMEGFEPRLPEEWNAADWSGGCQRKQPFRCGSGDGFRKISGVKFPDTRHARYNVSMSLDECEMACTRDCSCTAYAQLDIRNGGSGCLLWFHELMDMREFDEKQELYIRMAASELGEKPNFNKKKVLSLVLTISSAALLLSAVAYVCKKTKKRRGNWNAVNKKTTSVLMDDLDSMPFFSLHEIAKATDNFSINNKIGEGGFGPVYKGVLEDGTEVAVKRLSETSQQGLDEFKNEVICIAKLQHRNLVKLLGYCIHGNELILVYEYMANKSLDCFLFDETRSSILDWPRRFHIINGMARGILYLHQDSRLQIIHRDLKAGNILLDADMNPKISDFGLARKFVGKDVMAKTKKVVGTYGYISPEYAVHGRFSIKSDVFSFGVLVLEIVSGKKNREFSRDGHGDNLLGHAWRLYKDGKSIEIICASLRNSCIVLEVLRAIHVGLLCVQHHAEDRPTMLSVVLMLVSESALPPPKQPAFFTEESFRQYDFVSSQDEYMITLFHAR
ncbi:hypothetical protein OSB04_018660 [Centaurea solstitialis]|uniref:non-specific serine/threonine protein kinase n=1 Tax=Centaurea solstitialis TaxID=347529 RepID=A0AA38WJI8_9ASTR|nr:hypothetical protein OSB04_018660 [Centaurea solstitialis]